MKAILLLCLAFAFSNGKLQNDQEEVTMEILLQKITFLQLTVEKQQMELKDVQVTVEVQCLYSTLHPI